MKTTPTPWHAVSTARGWEVRCDNECITGWGCVTQSEANAALIVRAVNAHDDLLAAAELGLEWLDDCTPETMKDQIKAAIQKARNG